MKSSDPVIEFLRNQFLLDKDNLPGLAAAVGRVAQADTAAFYSEMARVLRELATTGERMATTCDMISSRMIEVGPQS